MNENNREQRYKAFLSDYESIVKKHGIDLATMPVFVPDGAGGFKLVLQTQPVDLQATEESVIVPEGS